jgi:hypothetical protein
MKTYLGCDITIGSTLIIIKDSNSSYVKIKYLKLLGDRLSVLDWVSLHGYKFRHSNWFLKKKGPNLIYNIL